MIRNDDELDIVRDQLRRAETALQSIRRDVLPQSPARFALISEPYVAEIKKLRNEMDAYLGLLDPALSEAADDPN